jgi:hypothetical protein
MTQWIDIVAEREELRVVWAAEEEEQCQSKLVSQLAHEALVERDHLLCGSLDFGCALAWVAKGPGIERRGRLSLSAHVKGRRAAAFNGTA